MCGIAGVLGSQAAPGSVRPLIEQLTHRGPNGVRVEDAPGASLGHARLSIIDLEGGWQPLTAAGSTVIGNGEIYNYLELIEEFGLNDKLTTGSDFEPLLHLYALEGDRAFDRLRGMYAFCLLGADGRDWLVRDPFGIKPLYVIQKEDSLAFASEAGAFVRAGLKPHLETEQAAQLLSLNYTVGSDTIFGGVARLAPGEIVEVKDGVVAGVRARPALVRTPRPTVPDLDALDRVLEDSVRVHQRSDVPYGLFLSGGIDSATVAALMSRLNERPVTAFTCGFDAEGASDERRQAEAVARALDLDWRETSFGEADFWRIAPLAAQALDDPTTDYATLPTYKLAEAAKGTLTVVLTGEGGDELFAGYSRYRRALRPVLFGGRPAEPQLGFEGFAEPVTPLDDWRDDTEAARTAPGLTRLQRAQAADVAAWLPDDLLLKLDRCLMAHGLEGRTPFLDPEVARFAFNLPDRAKVRGRHGKHLLRQWLERHCPAAQPWAKKKGFTVPVAGWLAPRAADLGPRIAAVEGVAQVCDIDAVTAVFSDGGKESARWPLLFFALWWRIHFERATPDEAMASLLGTR
ncbi:MAG TPA: asparagine synthase (glutamine-hydrolyzing) [Caulobacteraceae bacterium]|jgi:asparagine synthase (glutamine-hydrolysing)